jgi:hypothetical protein
MSAPPRHGPGRVRRFDEMVLLIESAGQGRCKDFEKPFPDEAFSVVIWSPERALFPEPPEVQFVRSKLCVTGHVEQYGEKPEIVVRAPAQLVLDRD